METPMPLSFADLTVQVDAEDIMGALDAAWRWIVPASMEPLVMTTMGDLFLRDADGSVHRLSAMYGELERVADNVDSFKKASTTKENLEDWFFAEVVSIQRGFGKKLKKGETYGFAHPIALGGEFGPSNIENTAAGLHLFLQGQILEQIGKLPPDASVTEVRIDDDGRVQLVFQ